MPSSVRGYEFFEHTADVGMRATGDTLAELFVHAARGLVALVAEESDIKPKEARPIQLAAATKEALLEAWLTELIVWFDTDHFLPAEYDLASVSETSLKGAIRGERFDPKRHDAGREVKAVTRHEFSIQKADDKWEARVIFDV